MDTPFSKLIEQASANRSRRERIRLRVWMALPLIRKEIEAAVSAELALDGEDVTASGLIDWENFDPDKFDRLIEAILRIIELFL